MATYVLIPGAGGSAWYWHRVVPLLRERGHDAIAVELPAGDDRAGLEEYADVVVDAIGDRRELVLVAQSLGAFTGPLVCARVPVDLLVLLNPMIPAPGERAGAWWGAVGQPAARRALAEREGRTLSEEFDLREEFFHDVPEELTAVALATPGEQSDTPMAEPWPLDAWPDVPTRVLQGRDDRCFPLELQRRVARERLGLEVEELPGGHLASLSEPEAVVAALERCRAAVAAQAPPAA